MAETNKGKQRRGMSRQEAGKKGGEAVREKFDPEHFKDIDREGGETIEEEYGSEYFNEIGKKGGEARDKDENETERKDR